MQAKVWLLFLLFLISGNSPALANRQLGNRADADEWVELAPGIRYQLAEGRISLDYSPPLFTAEGAERFLRFAQDQMAKTTTEEEKRYWEEEMAWVKGQHALWDEAELVVTALEFAILSRFPLPLSDADRQALRAKLSEIVQQMKRGVDPQSLPESELPPQLRTPDGGMVVGPDTFPILVQSLTLRSLFPSCSLAASAMPTSSSPGAKTYATAFCNAEFFIWGKVETRTTARAGNDQPPPCYDSGWPASQCMRVAYGNTGCHSTAWVGYFYQLGYLKTYSARRSAFHGRCR
ncbi:hypothetical protein [Thermus sp. NMX2.A1]|uniref:hypothetical protein n=1 Tax=Thermus sp. NMX2.A1 TaxID=570924 RepID=UPI0003DCE914|nr:hypothetical protein [Thermus sp. NMX2.A1]ETN88096.1 hypothetical protein TNMX_08425 [Thermus sp. NMX2.A1]